jgi:hypothetical protein
MSATALQADPRDRRIAELEAENGRLRSELARIRRGRSSYAGRRQAAIESGTWQPFADTGPVRDHIRAVMAATGITANAFANVAGVEWMTVGAVLDGTRPTIRTASAGKLMAVTAETVEASAQDARVDAAGTRRRLQALAVQGWSVREVSRRSGTDNNVLSQVRSGEKTVVAVKTRRAVAAVYDKLAATEPPLGTRPEKTAAGRNRSAAQRMGWLSHWAWDDDTIDDPAAQPAEGHHRPGRRLSGADLAAEVRELLSFGLSRADAADRLGVTLAAAEKALERYPRTEAGEAA